jgi:hypothetical protein
MPKLKAVLIIGPDNIGEAPNLIREYKRNGGVVIGDGERAVKLDELSCLRGRLGFNTRIDIFAHGKAIGGKHFVQLKDELIATGDVVRHLKPRAQREPLQINLWSCYAGAAAKDVEELNPGSVLFAHGSDYLTWKPINVKGVLSALSYHVSTEKDVPLISIDFPQCLTQTLSVGVFFYNKIYTKTIRPAKGVFISNKETYRLLRYHKEELREFLRDIQLNKVVFRHDSRFPSYTAYEFNVDHFIYCCSNGSAEHFNNEVFKKYAFSVSNGFSAAKAALQGGSKILQQRFMITEGMVSFAEERGFSMLKTAVASHIKMVDLLMSRGASATAKSEDDKSAIDVAIGKRDAVLVIKLLSHAIRSKETEEVKNYLADSRVVKLINGSTEMISPIIHDFCIEHGIDNFWATTCEKIETPKRAKIECSWAEVVAGRRRPKIQPEAVKGALSHHSWSQVVTRSGVERLL